MRAATRSQKQDYQYTAREVHCTVYRDPLPCKAPPKYAKGYPINFLRIRASMVLIRFPTAHSSTFRLFQTPRATREVTCSSTLDSIFFLTIALYKHRKQVNKPLVCELFRNPQRQSNQDYQRRDILVLCKFLLPSPRHQQERPSVC